MVHEPVQGGLAGVEDREVSVVRTEPEFGRRATPREPLAVRARYDPVQAAMDEEHCRGYLGGVEAHGATYARSSSIAAAGPAAMAGRTTSSSQDHVPESAARSLGVNSGS